MNIKQQALGGFKRASDEAVLAKGKTVLLAMTNNPNFENPNPALAALVEVVDTYEQKLSVARWRRRSTEDTTIKNEARNAVEKMLKRLAFYVTHAADGSLSVLLSSGFDVSGLPQKKDAPTGVTGVNLRDGGQSGQMRLDFDKNKLAKIYEYQICEVDSRGLPGEWNEGYITTSSRHNVIAPLTFLQCYGVRVRAINGYGRSEWSEIVIHVVR
ncbi:hypothetical protein [Sphingobacterium corticibacterium]|uniref:Fibronectin type-III domain-containing protein n=1 Tax=Sphingobacterium corticibacterium TaxID=2484746 RepID=A0A4Q6XUP2_9SPHI|nr:hypothetical protein [Sphingobacterium corticibacterium]RZF61362.1 hypothetical protein EWE74_00505 [Sphingobacterium corticibacterium]